MTKRSLLAARHLRISLTYFGRHGRWPDIDNPARFTEFVQHRKLFDHDIRMPGLIDKVSAKQLVAERIGHEWIVPTLWEGPTLPDQSPCPEPFVVKSRHGCNQNAFVRNVAADWEIAQRQSKRWMQCGVYGKWLDEWAYSRIPKGLLIEPYIGNGDTLPLDYKIYVFGGIAQCVQVHLGRGSDHRWIVFDRNWQRISAPSVDNDPAPPTSLQRMLNAAQDLAIGFDFVRADFYEVERCPLFGELCFYPGSGLDRFDPVALDLTLGRLWGESRHARQSGIEDRIIA